MPLEKPGTPEELVHFGVRGMRWGVRKKEEISDRKVSNFKPGPIRQKLIKYHTDVAKKQQTRIEYLKANPGSNFYTRRVNANEIKRREKYQNQQLKDIKNLKEGHLTDFQKKALIGAAITVTVLGAYGAYKLHDSRARRYIQTGDKIIGIPYKRNDLLSRKMTSKQIMDEIVPQVNPNRTRSIGRNNNCLRASFAYELRRRGFDVEATSSAKGGTEGQNVYGMLRAMSGGTQRKLSEMSNPLLGEHDIGFLPSDMISDGKSTSSRIFNSLSRQEEGARGELGMSWKFGGAHSVAWEIIGRKAHIFDAQTGKHYQTPEEFSKVGKNIFQAAYTRLDNVDLDEKFLTDWIQNVK